MKSSRRRRRRQSSVLDPISSWSPTSLSNALDTATSSAVAGTLPSDTAGMPGPSGGAPKTLTFFGVDPSLTVVPANTCGAALGDTVDVPRRRDCVFRERRGADERAGRARRDHPVVDARVVDGVVGFDAEPVREPGEDERHREDDAGADDRDDEASPSPLQVAQRRDQHSSNSPAEVARTVARARAHCHAGRVDDAGRVDKHRQTRAQSVTSRS